MKTGWVSSEGIRKFERLQLNARTYLAPVALVDDDIARRNAQRLRLERELRQLRLKRKMIKAQFKNIVQQEPTG